MNVVQIYALQTIALVEENKRDLLSDVDVGYVDDCVSNSFLKEWNYAK